MTQFVESLSRLYALDKIELQQLDKLLKSNKINQQEYNYIISAKNVI